MSERLKHTPGPWRPLSGFVATEQNKVIATTSPPPGTLMNWAVQPGDISATANARLIAAAPELAVELQSIVDQIEEAIDHKIHTGRMPPVGRLLSQIRDGAQILLDRVEGPTDG